MAICKTKRFKKTRLCTADLRHWIQLVLREQQPNDLNQTEMTETFTNLYTIFAAVETVSGTMRFNSIGIDEKTTHFFYIRYSVFSNNFLDKIEKGNHFIRYNNKYYQILRAENQNEDGLIIVIQAVERGDESKEASQA